MAIWGTTTEFSPLSPKLVEVSRAPTQEHTMISSMAKSYSDLSFCDANYNKAETFLKMISAEKQTKKKNTKDCSFTVYCYYIQGIKAWILEFANMMAHITCTANLINSSTFWKEAQKTLNMISYLKENNVFETPTHVKICLLLCSLFFLSSFWVSLKYHKIVFNEWPFLLDSAGWAFIEALIVTTTFRSPSVLINVHMFFG